jgi:hypothetical protein
VQVEFRRADELDDPDDLTADDLDDLDDDELDEDEDEQ